MLWPDDESGAGPRDSDAGNTWPKRFGYYYGQGRVSKESQYGRDKI